MSRQGWKKRGVMALALCMAAMWFGACADNSGQWEPTEAPAYENRGKEGEESGEGSNHSAASEKNDRKPAEPAAEPTASPVPVEPTVRDVHDELAKERESAIRELYEQRLILKEAVRTIVAQEIEGSSLVTVNPRERFSVTEVLIDEATGNPILSEGVKSFIQAATEGKSLQEMCGAALEGGMSQIPDYLAGEAESALKDAVADLIGMDIFAPLSLIAKWRNPDQEPTALLQGIVEEQQKDVYALTLFMQQEDIGTADIYKVAQMVHAVEQRSQEVSAARGGYREYTGNEEKLRRLAEQYADTEALMAAYAQLELTETVPELNQDDRDRVRKEQAEVSGMLKKYEALYSLSVGNVAANYDVEGFRETQKTTSQSGMFGNLILGDLAGGMLAESGQVVEDQIQANRRELCELLTDSVEESYVEVAAAQGAFMEQYCMLTHVSEASGNKLYFAEVYLENYEWEEQLKAAAETYLTALINYVSDLESANILYNCILTSQQADYLFELQLEIDGISQVIQDFEWYAYGYSNDEILSRWSRLVDCYIKSVTYILERGGALGGQTPGFCSNGTGKLGGIDYKIYTKEFAAGSRPVLIQGGGRSYYYDMNGHLICVDASYERITGRGMYLLSYLSYATGAELQTVWGMDLYGPERERMTEQSVKADELYSYVRGILQ